MLVERSNFTISRMGRLLGVSRSGFYAWLGRAPTKRTLRAERIEAKVPWFHGDSDEVSGSPRILADLRDDGEVISRKTVAKTMRELHLKGVCPKGGRQVVAPSSPDMRDAPPGKPLSRKAPSIERALRRHKTSLIDASRSPTQP